MRCTSHAGWAGFFGNGREAGYRPQPPLGTLHGGLPGNPVYQALRRLHGGANTHCHSHAISRMRMRPVADASKTPRRHAENCSACLNLDGPFGRRLEVVHAPITWIANAV